ncbi:porin family protein [Arsenicitalea aurantiaca]|uniref:Porin family protein n=1 Tax=Arsenicitalea aurantiaca TaxID=1783274 RepID=A0A433XF27_9HYPH|nr:outer membrane protein [Arsenicitalea aurantiaca]RUT32695.1 porin family protein [Arsenicitalea aurantiaca]
MKLTTKLLAASAASVLMTASAFAADLYVPIEQPYVPEVAAAAPLGWTGAYVGVHAGYGWGQFDLAGDDETTFFTPGDSDVDGWLAGVQAGYNVNLDGVVLGIEGDIAWADLNGSATIGTGDDAVTVSSNIDWIGTIRGRVGFAADAFLLYGTAGVAFAGASMDVAALEPTEAFSDDNVHTGWVVGAGVETMVTDNISLKAEYLYHDFGNETFSFDDTNATDASFNVQTAKIGLNFHF